MLTHVRELDLRRLFAGEEIDGARAHLEGCEGCRAAMAKLEEAQRAFEKELPFERFERGVVAKLERKAEPVRPRRSLGPVLALAASIACAVIAAPVILDWHRQTTFAPNRLKGGAEIELRVAGPANGPQRIAAIESPEPLGPGERVRIGYRPGSHRFVAAVSIDAHGEVTPLYPETGTSLPAGEPSALHYLPGSLEFTGKGAEEVIVVLSDAPLAVDTLTRAAKDAYARAHGDVLHLPELAVEGEQFHRTVIKP